MSLFQKTPQISAMILNYARKMPRKTSFFYSGRDISGKLKPREDSKIQDSKIRFAQMKGISTRINKASLTPPAYILHTFTGWLRSSP
jgi:hypothetical protein